MSSIISQSSCFSAIHNRSHLHLLRSKPICMLVVICKNSKIEHQKTFDCLAPVLDRRFQVLMMINNNGHAIKTYTLESKSTLNHRMKLHNDILGKPNSSTVEYVNGEEIVEPTENEISEQKRSAKIHDFCFGIPYGGIVFSGGIIGFIFSRNPASLMTGGLYGGALLALSILSLKIWRQGQSSTPFILGQLGIAAALLWKNIQAYSLTKKILPTGFNIFLSTAMLCFFTYVIVSGGNPPPKKLKSSAASES